MDWRVILKLSAVYFGVVFAVGFVLGVVRVFWLVPVAGERAAELIELPVMIGVTVIAAGVLVDRWRDRLSYAAALISGLISLTMLIVVEFSIVLYARGLTLGEYLATRDPVSGAFYALSLLIFAAMPWMAVLWNRRG